VTIVTSQGRKVETIPFNGRDTPFRHNDFMVLRVAVDGKPCPAWQIPAMTWDEEAATLRESEFWQNVADAALSMSDAEVALRN
jgi:hypothetical protein